MTRVEAGLLARQAGVADEVGWVDVGGGLHQGDVVVQLAVGRVAEVLVPVDPLHGEDPLCRLRALQLVLPQDDPPAAGILRFAPVETNKVDLVVRRPPVACVCVWQWVAASYFWKQ